MSLTNLSNRIALRRPDEALAASDEAVAIYRELAAILPEAFKPDLASSLSNLSTRLAELGRREEALVVIDEAVAIRRDLVAFRPDAFRPDLASTLYNRFRRLADLGRREEALAAIEEAVALYRELAAVRPDAIRPELATSLDNLSAFLAQLGRREDALAAIEEAVDIRRELALAAPAVYLSSVARGLNNLSNRLGDSGRPEEALVALREAAAIFRGLAAVRPEAFGSDLALCLDNLARRLYGLGRREEAETVRRQAAEQAARHRSSAAAAPGASGVAARDTRAVSWRDYVRDIPLADSALRARRANEKAKALHAALGPFITAHPYAARIELDRERDGLFEYSARVVTGGIDPFWNVRVGEILHNYRASLDNAIWDLVKRVGNDPTRNNAFPISDEERFYLGGPGIKTPAISRLDGTSDLVHEIVEAAQPYKARDNGLDPHQQPLWVLKELSDIDKHRTLHVMNVGARIHNKATISTPDGAEIIDASPILEAHLLGDGDVLFTFRSDRPILDGEVIVQTEFASNIFFDDETVAEVPGVARRTVMTVLKDIDETVKTIGKALRTTVETRERSE